MQKEQINEGDNLACAPRRCLPKCYKVWRRKHCSPGVRRCQSNGTDSLAGRNGSAEVGGPSLGRGNSISKDA